MSERPRIPNTPGLVWRKHRDGWEATWRARADLVERGYTPKNVPLWHGSSPSAMDAARLSDECNRLQDEMLVWGRGGTPKANVFEGTMRSLINCYQTDPLSTYGKRRYNVRVNSDATLRRIADRHGHEDLADIKARQLLTWHDEWTNGGNKLAMGQSFIGLLRTMFAFGMTILEDHECERLCVVLSKMRFKAPQPRCERITLAQVDAVRLEAHRLGYHSIALAQAFQFDLMLRQRDVIGEMVPISEPGVSDFTYGGRKWLRGLRWSEISDTFILRHVTSKRQKLLEVDLKLAPMAMEELQFTIDFLGERPAAGPIVICESTGRPWSGPEFRRKWRLCAKAAGVPKNVLNMDSRAGAITEATEAGADIEHVKHAATHSDISMTQRYSRGAREKTDNVLSIRAASRNKPKPE